MELTSADGRGMLKMKRGSGAKNNLGDGIGKNRKTHAYR